MDKIDWRKSERSGNGGTSQGGGNCVEVGVFDGVTASA